MKAVRWGAALAFLALSATVAAAQDLPTKAIEVPQSRHWIDYPPNWGYDPLAKQVLLGIEEQGLFASQDGGGKLDAHRRRFLSRSNVDVSRE